MNSNKIDLSNLSMVELIDFCINNGQKTYGGKQLFRWIHKHGLDSFEKMTNLSKRFRELLAQKAYVERLIKAAESRSIDGTVKSLWQTGDGNFIESVLIPDDKRLTLCLSSQIGCPIGCRYCATGLAGFKRNLTGGEIYNQFIQTKNKLPAKMKITNVVFMGMGEPLLNYNEVKRAINFLTSQDGGGLAYRKITISTIGLINGIKTLIEDNPRLGLAISLHSAIQEKRDRIIPKVASCSLRELRSVADLYVKKSRRRITFEYILIDGFNDSIDDAEALLKFIKGLPCKINLIACNQVQGSPFKPPTEPKIMAFEEKLLTHTGVVTRRKSMGRDIGAACGQLAGRANLVIKINSQK